MKVQFVYPNLYGANMIPPAIGVLNSRLLSDGHMTSLFDTTDYAEWQEDPWASDHQKTMHLNARPFDDTLLDGFRKKGIPEQDFVDSVRSFQPELLAFSCTEDMYPNAIRLLQCLEAHTRPVVLAGGVFPTFAPELALRASKGLIDYVLIGEGEDALPEFCLKLQAGMDVRSVPGICYIDSKRGFQRGPIPAPVDSNSVCMPDYHFFEESRFYRPMQGKLRRMFPVESIRGCPYTCAYCNSPSQNVIYKSASLKFFRKTNTAKIEEQIRYLIENYAPDSFYFWADTFLAQSDQEFFEFCEMYEKYKLPFWIQTRPETVDLEKFERLLEVGLLRVAFGVEHGNPEFREKYLRRRVDNEMIVRNLNGVGALGIPFSVNNIMGFPYETRELAFDTIQLNRKINSDGINAYSFTPFHGTPLRTVSEIAGFIDKGEIARSIMKPTMLRMPQWSAEQIEGLRRCFVLYVKLPEDKWHLIQRAEESTPAGDEMWARLREEVLANYMNWGDRDESEDMVKTDFPEPSRV